MAKIVCENCKLDIEVPEDYSAPFLRCPDCGTIQKYKKISSGEPKFKILDEKSRKKVSNISFIKENNNPPKEIISDVQNQTNIETTNENADDSDELVDEKTELLDSVGEEVLQKAYKLVSKYINSSSDKIRKKQRAKAIQSLMKEKYPISLASKIIIFAEKAPESQNYAKNNNIVFYVIIGVIALIIIIALISFI